MREKKKKKIDWELVIYIAIIAIGLIGIIAYVVIKVWVIMEYGGLPISEVPAWAVPWIMDRGGSR